MLAIEQQRFHCAVLFQLYFKVISRTSRLPYREAGTTSSRGSLMRIRFNSNAVDGSVVLELNRICMRETQIELISLVHTPCSLVVRMYDLQSD